MSMRPARRTGGCSARSPGMTPRWRTRSRRPGPPAGGGGRGSPGGGGMGGSGGGGGGGLMQMIGPGRERAGIPGEVRHAEKWRLALEMIDEMTGPGGWGLLEQVTVAGGARPVVVADAGYGEGADFRLGLAGRGWRYVIAVKGATSARPHDAVPGALA